eukprot:6178678-Pleurochrysis_carterae.AAC.1
MSQEASCFASTLMHLQTMSSWTINGSVQLPRGHHSKMSALCTLADVQHGDLASTSSSFYLRLRQWHDASLTNEQPKRRGRLSRSKRRNLMRRPSPKTPAPRPGFQGAGMLTKSLNAAAS